MRAILEILGPVHAAVGFVGLALFWIPVFAKKGGKVHVRFGKGFVLTLYFVAVTAFVSSILRMVEPLDPEKTYADPARSARIIRAQFAFLAYLGIVTLLAGRQAVLSARTRKAPETMRTGPHLALIYVTMASSVALAALALLVKTPLQIPMLALSPLGLFIGSGSLRYMRKPRATKMTWWYEHMGNILGAGIAFHTAFFVFGAGRIGFLSLPGNLAWIPWVAPAAIGLPASALWTRHYRRKFGESRR